ncbi:MAG: hypothetical protein J0L93_11055 [Deltaproteobacteria bacterium]|nr:hypothetical protein [Deltaproteobacteria bacterium]
MKFHFLAGVLLVLIGGIFYLLISGMSSEFSEARPRIEKESVQKALKKELKTDSEDYSKYLNKNIHEQVAEPAPLPTPAPVEKKPEPVHAPVVEEEGVYQGEKYWCRSAMVQKFNNPVKCHYQDSCFKCKDSYVIPPESEYMNPFCEDGTKAEMYSVECCPTSVVNGEIVCPTQMECLSAEAIPENLCTCGSKTDCRYVTVGERVECACIQK